MPGSLLIVTGAGASKGAVPSAPLADDLFSPRYDDISRWYGGVDGLRLLLQKRLHRGKAAGQTLESILGETLRNPHPDIQQMLREIPVYLREVIEKSARSTRATAYDELIMHAKSRGIDVCFVTLNYDVLLEEAIERRYEFESYFSSMSAYVGRDKWKLVKLHGSVNWVLPVAPSTRDVPPKRSDWIRTEEVWNFLHKIPPEITIDPEATLILEHPRWFDGEALLYPVLAIPQDRSYESVCPQSHIAVVQEFLDREPGVLVIGNRGADSDLMALLARPPRSKPRPFRVIDPSSDADVIAMNFSNIMGLGGFQSPRRAEGFAEWLDGTDVEFFMDRVAESS